MSPAAAATVDVQLSPTANGSATVNVGDTITFRNVDLIPRQPIFSSTTGLACSDGVVVQPGSAKSCVVTLPGVFTYTDVTRPGLASGTITVNSAPAGVPAAPLPTLTLTPTGPVVGFGDTTTLTGTISPAAVGTPVDLLAKALGDSSFSKVGSTLTTTGGAFTFTFVPTAGTQYKAEAAGTGGSAASPVTTVKIRPKVTLKKRFVKKGRAYLTASVLAAASHSGKRIIVQRHLRQGGWKTLKRVRLNAKSTAKFAVRLPKGRSSIRAFIPASQVAPGYAQAASNTVRVKRK